MKESLMVPSNKCKFLGNIFNTKKMVVELPQEKKVKIKKKMNKFKLLKECKIRGFASLVGTLGSCCITLKYGRVHLRDFERARYLALEQNRDNYEATMNITKNLQDDLNWWCIKLNKAENKIS